MRARWSARGSARRSALPRARRWLWPAASARPRVTSHAASTARRAVPPSCASSSARRRASPSERRPLRRLNERPRHAAAHPTPAPRLTIGTKVGHRLLPERSLDVRQPDLKRLHGASRVRFPAGVTVGAQEPALGTPYEQVRRTLCLSSASTDRYEGHETREYALAAQNMHDGGHLSASGQ